MRHLINKHYDTPGGLLGHPTNVSSHPKPPVSLKEDETMKQTIISLSSDRVHTGTMDELVDFVNNHPDCRAGDYAYEMPRNFANNPNPNFKFRLKQLGYSFDVCGRAIKGGE